MGGGGVASDSTESNRAEDGVPVNIRCSNGSKFSVQIALASTVGSFKSVLARTCDVPADQQRLIYKGRILKDDQSLQSYGLGADHTVHLVRGFAPAPSTINASATSDGRPNTAWSSTGIVASNEGGPVEGSNLGDTLFQGLGMNPRSGISGLFGSESPVLEQVQQRLAQNPNIMREILSMPVYQNLLNSPELMRNLVMSNSQMREIIDRNPELAHVFNDPSTLRQALEAARNPEFMREMMRNTDRAMSNIESSPEGFNMLRRMYETVQEPFLNATTTAGDSRNNIGSNPFAALLGGQGRAQAQGQFDRPSETPPNSSSSPAPNSNPLPNPWATVGAGGAQANLTPGSNPLAGREAASAGLGGLGFPDLERMFGTMQDTDSPSQLQQNPALSQMMQSLFSNRQYMNQIIDLNPQLRNMLDSNPQIRETMQNPEFIRQLASPETMQPLMTLLQQSLLSQLGRQQGSQESGQTAGSTGAPNNMGLEMLMNMFGGLGAGGPTVPSRSDVPAEELYATQLAQLQEMGFFDREENVRALIATSGNVHAAVERLLGSPAQ